MKILLTGCMVCALAVFNGTAFARQAGKGNIDFIPVAHASFAIMAPDAAIYVDPTGAPGRYAKMRAPDIILVTHAHPDHFDGKLIAALKKPGTVVVGPKEVIDALSYGEALRYGESRTYGHTGIEAVPAYNTTPGRLQYHPKGSGNGYVVTVDGKRLYVSGDTEDIPEMRNLKNIDYAFVCMNLPYTMSVEQAASAVLAFQPGVVFPYHYREKGGFSDIAKFKELVSKNKNIEVRFLKWY